MNKERYFETNGTIKPEALFENAWLRYLVSVRQPYWNAERIGKMADKEKNGPLEYVLRTLDFLVSFSDLSDEDYTILRTVLCWSEVAKAGSDQDRSRWIERGYPLDIHNEASAMIYADHFCVRRKETDPIYVLIKTHGLAGQYVRGECAAAGMQGLVPIARKMGRERFVWLFEALNECIIKAVDPKIWQAVKDQIRDLGEAVCADSLTEMTPVARLRALLPGCGQPQEEDTAFFEKNVFGRFDLWYFQAALEPFGFAGAAAICRAALRNIPEDSAIRNLSFKPLADTLYYDYEGKKSINTYKQRIIEKYLADPASYDQHVHLTTTTGSSLALVGVSFTPVCDKLIDFCVEAERSGLLTYEKSITMLYDTFGFRRDQFDRLNNEEKYLRTMNTADDSTKITILDYAVGQVIVDVGSGGGVLLDRLEERYPEKEIIGTDISQNVIQVLEKRKREHGRHWNAVRHNFVDAPFDRKVDSII